MEETAAVGDLGIEQRRIGRQRLFLKNVERCARDDFFF
jgi:hypothetical protein